jgi:hypothetical protein
MATDTTRALYMNESGLGTDLVTTALQLGANTIFADGE